MQLTPLVGAVLVLDAIRSCHQRFISGDAKSAGGDILIVSAVALSFLPVLPSWMNGSTIARLPTLRPVVAENSEAGYTELANFVRSYKGPKQILTDPITGYVLRGMTGAKIFTNKFQWHPEHSLVRKRYSPSSFNEHAGWLLVVHLRAGLTSRNGEISGHWSGDVLNTKRFYSEELLSWIDNRESLTRNGATDSGTTRIRAVWEKGEFTVYEISVR